MCFCYFRTGLITSRTLWRRNYRRAWWVLARHVVLLPLYSFNKLKFSWIIFRKHEHVDEIMKYAQAINALADRKTKPVWAGTFYRCATFDPVHTPTLLLFFVVFSSDGGDGDWRGHRHSPHRHPHLLHLTEDPASKSVTAETLFSSVHWAHKNEILTLSLW